MILSCMLAQISGKFSSINCLRSSAVAVNVSLNTLLLPAFCKKYKIEVFNPLKLKFNPGICGSGN